jgi:hypothetical protein
MSRLFSGIFPKMSRLFSGIFPKRSKLFSGVFPKMGCAYINYRLAVIRDHNTSIPLCGAISISYANHHVHNVMMLQQHLILLPTSIIHGYQWWRR